jgi:hypothetical protein
MGVPKTHHSSASFSLGFLGSLGSVQWVRLLRQTVVCGQSISVLPCVLPKDGISLRKSVSPHRTLTVACERLGLREMTVVTENRPRLVLGGVGTCVVAGLLKACRLERRKMATRLERIGCALYLATTLLFASIFLT